MGTEGQVGPKHPCPPACLHVPTYVATCAKHQRQRQQCSTQDLATGLKCCRRVPPGLGTSICRSRRAWTHMPPTSTVVRRVPFSSHGSSTPIRHQLNIDTQQEPEAAAAMRPRNRCSIQTINLCRQIPMYIMNMGQAPPVSTSVQGWPNQTSGWHMPRIPAKCTAARASAPGRRTWACRSWAAGPPLWRNVTGWRVGRQAGGPCSPRREQEPKPYAHVPGYATVVCGHQAM